jgi:hypothetical protein
MILTRTCCAQAKEEMKDKIKKQILTILACKKITTPLFFSGIYL